MTVVLDARTVREVLNIHFCRKCRQDTMPSDLTGRCFFCDTKIAEPVAETPAPPAPRHCVCCDKELPADAPLGKRYCDVKCRNRAWEKSDRGIAFRDSAQKRRNARKRYLRALARSGFCRVCGQVLPKHKEAYCSQACRAKARRDARRAA